MTAVAFFLQRVRNMEPFCIGLPPHVEDFDDDVGSFMFLTLESVPIDDEASISGQDPDPGGTEGERHEKHFQETIKQACKVIGMIAVAKECTIHTDEGDVLRILESVECEIQKALQDVVESARDGIDCQKRVRALLMLKSRFSCCRWFCKSMLFPFLVF